MPKFNFNSIDKSSEFIEIHENLIKIENIQGNFAFSHLYYLSLYAFNNKFIIDTLSKDFVDTEINEKFLRKIYNFNKDDEEGDDEIAKNILELVRELLLKLNFTDGLAYDLLCAWQEYEEIIFDIKRFYREHFIHQFKDFLIGCLFLEKLWQSSKAFYDQRRFLRRWLLTALFHDVGYPAESLGEMKDNLHKRFFNKIPNYLISEIKLGTYDQQDENLPKLFKNIALIHLFSENISISDIPITKMEHYSMPHIEIYNLLMDEFKQTHDHGVTGAIFFLKTALIDLREVVIDPTSTYKTTISTDYEPYSHLIDDIFVAASAIAGHNLRINTYPSYTVDFSTRPIAALLNLCDDFQEWNRREKNPDNRLAWTSGPIKLDEIILEENLLTIKSSALEKADETYIFKLKKSIKQLFLINLSDINMTFYKEIKFVIKSNVQKSSSEISCKLNIGEEQKNKYRIGRYTVNKDDDEKKN